MAEPFSLGTRQGPEHLVAQAERQLAAIGEQIDTLIDSLSSGQADVARDVAPAVASLRKALEALFHERARLERLERPDDGASGLDLQAARDEIDCRMARLVAALASDGLSEGS